MTQSKRNSEEEKSKTVHYYQYKTWAAIMRYDNGVIGWSLDYTLAADRAENINFKVGNEPFNRYLRSHREILFITLGMVLGQELELWKKKNGY